MLKSSFICFILPWATNGNADIPKTFVRSDFSDFFFKSAWTPRVRGGNVKSSPMLRCFPMKDGRIGLLGDTKGILGSAGGGELTEEIIKVASKVPNEHCWWKEANYAKEMRRFLLSSPLIPDNKDPSPEQSRGMGAFAFSGLGESTEQWWCGCYCPRYRIWDGWIDTALAVLAKHNRSINKFVSIFLACHAGK